jgi:hypothetical protein
VATDDGVAGNGKSDVRCRGACGGAGLVSARNTAALCEETWRGVARRWRNRAARSRERLAARRLVAEQQGHARRRTLALYRQEQGIIVCIAFMSRNCKGQLLLRSLMHGRIEDGEGGDVVRYFG